MSEVTPKRPQALSDQADADGGTAMKTGKTKTLPPIDETLESGPDEFLLREAEEHALRHSADMEVEEDPGGGIRLRDEPRSSRSRGW